MKQVLQNLRTGELELVDIPCPQVSPGHVLIGTTSSLISAGTERSLVEFSKATLIQKARQQPDRVKQVLDKIKSDGVLPTLEAVFARLDQPLPLGYCNAGRVLAIGSNVEGLEVGQRVASNGGHAEIVHVPKNLCIPVPDSVADDHAAFTVLASIGLQGIRLLQPTLGECIAVYGLGLVGLLSVQMLVAAGIRVCGIDLDPQRLELAEQFGAIPINASTSNVVAHTTRYSDGGGVDGVLITASAKQDSIVHQAAQMTRKRGRIVLVGIVNLDLQRADFYEKELSFQVSCSYGPGRYDAEYEQHGRDYPPSYVRWTEGRNLLAVTQMMDSGRLDVEPLITNRIAHTDAIRAYDLLISDKSQLGIVLQYPSNSPTLDRKITTPLTRQAVASETRVTAAVIGAGAFAQRVLLPELKRSRIHLAGIASAGGISAAHAAKKFGIGCCYSDYRELLAEPDINTVFITTRPHQHAPMIIEALQAGKHVFAEKPVAIDQVGLDGVRQAYEQAKDRLLLVGFNRRFSPHAVKMQKLLTGRVGPVCATVLINAGAFPADHWMHDANIGGGRLLGEVCHWIDLLRFLVNAPIRRVQATTIGRNSGSATLNDHVSISLEFLDGSLATIQYFANGPNDFPKERIELFYDQKSLQLDNFRLLSGYGFSDFRKMKLWRQKKGHREEFQLFIQNIEHGNGMPVSPDQIWNVTQATLAAQQSANSGTPVEISV